MPLLPSRMKFNDPAFALGERVEKKEAPKVCPFREFERGDRKPAAPYAAQAEAIRQKLTPAERELKRAESKALQPAAPVADPDGWIPHDGGPCPVDGEHSVFIKTKVTPEGHSAALPAHSWIWSGVIAYKLAAPAKVVEAEQPITPEGRLYRQKQLQLAGLPVEWDKVPVGTPVWVRDFTDSKWYGRLWVRLQSNSELHFRAKGPSDAFGCLWAYCKLVIEGVEP